MSHIQPFLSHLTGVFQAPVQAWSQPDGSIGSGAEGVYCGDERVVSTLTLDAHAAELRHVSTQVHRAGEVVFTYAVMVPAEVADPLVTLRRTRRVTLTGIHEDLRLSSALADDLGLDLELVLRPDCTTMARVKSGAPAAGPPRLAGPRWTWRDASTRAELRAVGGSVHLEESEVVVRWRPSVGAGGTVTVGWSLELADSGAPMVGAPDPSPLAGRRLRGADPRVQRLADRAFSDLDSLRMAHRDHPTEAFLAAGAPWFYTLFGRDSLIAARMLLPVDRALAGGTLRALAAHQGTVVDPETAEQPGKILHEVRRTELPLAAGFHLPPVYYGTIDATPLWITLLHDAWRAGMPDTEVAALLDHLEAALSWLAEHGDADGDGFLEYLDVSGHGLANQGWKDSGDSIRWHDGTVAEGPIALCEVQAYAYEAALAGAALLDAFDRGGGDRWRAWAALLRERFRSSFWCEDGQGAYPALALDRDKRPVDAVSSNLGHLLGTGILDPDEQRAVVRRLLDPTMFSGYGIRTLSTTNGAYWPLRYHAGSVWSHDTAVTIDGLLRDGFAEEAARVAAGLLTAAEGFDYRLPELFSGAPADEVWPPVPYPAACSPQAWAAASVVPVARALGVAFE